MVYIDKLTPPPGTLYYAYESIEPFSDAVISSKGTISWRVNIHKYATGAKPDDPQFKQKGGMIWVIMVHEGSIVSYLPGATNDKLHWYQKVLINKSKLVTAKQIPSTSDDVVDSSGKVWRYAIDYQQTFSMFNNGGNGVFAFEPQFKEDFSRQAMRQTGRAVDWGAEFSVYVAATPWSPTRFPINGVSVFRGQDPKVFPFTVTFEALTGKLYDDQGGWDPDGSAIKSDFTLNLNFPQPNAT